MGSTTPRMLLPAQEVSAGEPVAFRWAADSTERAIVDGAAAIRPSSAPVRIAPYAAAWSVELSDLATGRLVYLHDPAGQPAWNGQDRLVAFARAQVDDEMAADPLLAEVVWQWLTESFEGQQARLRALGGTVTCTASRRYGTLAHLSASHEAELRCSWTPLVHGTDPGPDLAPHLAALVATMAALCGLPPELPGVRRLG